MQTTSTQSGTNHVSLKSVVTFFTNRVNMFNFNTSLKQHLNNVSSETVGWLAILFIHCATIPSVLGLLLGVSDKLPSIDVVIFLWFSLMLLFIKSLINKDTLNIVTISVGFMVQASLLGLLVFK